MLRTAASPKGRADERSECERAFAAALFLKDVFSNITSISDEFEGRLFVSDGSAFNTVGFAYPGDQYYRNGAYKQIKLKNNYLKMSAS